MTFHHKIPPQDCRNMDDIRCEIDAIDQYIIDLLATRFEYVKNAAKFKTSATSVRAPERFQAMLIQRREWATQVGLDADVIEKMYRDIVNHFINEEMLHWQNDKELTI